MRALFAAAGVCIALAPALPAIAQPIIIPLSKQRAPEPRPPEPTPVPVAPPQAAANSGSDAQPGADAQASSQPQPPGTSGDAQQDSTAKPAQ